MFQKAVFKKFINSIDKALLEQKFAEFQASYQNPTKIEQIKNSKEEQYQEGFLRDVFVKILGYTINPEPNYNLITEKRNESTDKKDARKADGAIIINEQVKAVIELKGTDTTDLNKIENQALGYKAHNKGCRYIIISNFEKLRFYIDDVTEHIEFNLFTLDFSGFCELYTLLAYTQITADIPAKIKELSLNDEEFITKKFYKDYSDFKNAIFADICELNPSYDKLELFRKTQKLLDRMLFVLFCEDKGLLPANSVENILKRFKTLKENYTEKPLYDLFKQFFGWIDTGFKDDKMDIFAYNGGLFKSDEILDNIKISDEILLKHTHILANYDFDSDVSVDILGRIFEHSLAEIEEVQAQLQGKRDVSPTAQHDTSTIAAGYESVSHSERSEESPYKSSEESPYKSIVLSEKQNATNAKGFIYFVANKTNSVLYIGVTSNLQKRIYEHKTHQTEGFTDKYNCEKLVYFECFSSIKDAIEREKYLKGKKRDFKNELVNSINAKWLDLYEYLFMPEKRDVSPTAQHDTSTIAAGYESVSHSERSEESPYTNNINKRKKDGIFYTPAYITKYIVENTLGKLCDDKKTELGINDEKFSEILEQKRKGKTLEEARAKIDILKQYREFLLSLKICDPACGSGAFLNATLKFLKAEHKLIDEMDKKLSKAEFEFSYYDDKILENNIYGVDINGESVEIAKLALWLNTAQIGRKLSTLSNNIKRGNSLINSEFNWQEEFPEVFAKGGFDIIVGNPPYVFDREKFTEQEKNYYVKNYESAKYQVNLYILFIERFQKLLKTNGYCGMIVPNSWLMVYSGEDLRKYLYENVSLLKIASLLGKSFSDANVETVILIDKKTKATENTEVEIYKSDEVKKSFDFSHKLKQFDFAKNKGFEFTVFKTDENSVLIEKIKNNSLGLDVVASVKAGLKAYEKGKGNPKQSAEDVKSRIYDYTYKFDENTYKYLDGANVLRYGINWTGLWLQHGNHLAAPRTFDLFSGEKIIIREITGTYPRCVNATYTTDIYLFNMSNIAVIKRDEHYSLKYILAILNSTLMSFYFKKNTAKAERKLFPKIILNDLRLFPIKIATPEQQQPLAEFADKMLDLNAQLAKFTNNFWTLIKANYEIEKIPSALSEFYKLDFKEFLKISKIKVPISEQGALLEFFENSKNQCNAIKAQITNVENQINKAVYALYELNDDEIKEIENS